MVMKRRGEMAEGTRAGSRGEVELFIARPERWNGGAKEADGERRDCEQPDCQGGCPFGTLLL